MKFPSLKRIVDRAFGGRPRAGNAVRFTKDEISRDDCKFGDFTYGVPEIFSWGEGKRLSVGKFCSIAEGVKIFLGGGHRTDWVSTYPFSYMTADFPNAVEITGHPISKGDVTIGNDVWIAHGATIMSGVTIGDGAVIGTYSVVTKNVPPYTIVAGNPAVEIRTRFSKDDTQFLQDLKWWDWPVSTINENVELLCSGDISRLREKFESRK